MKDMLESFINEYSSPTFQRGISSSTGAPLQELQVYDNSGSLFILDKSKLKPFKFKVLDFFSYFKDVSKVYEKAAANLPQLLRFLYARKQLIALPCAHDRLLHSLPDDYQPHHLRLCNPTLKISAKLDLTKLLDRVIKHCLKNRAKIKHP